MSFDLVSTVMQQISPQMMAKMASALGMESGLATRAIGAIVPSLLGSFATAASTPAGATTLGQALASLGPDSLTQITNMIGTGEQASLIEDGTTLLGHVIGGPAAGNMVTAAGTFSGLNSQASKGLVGMLAPAVMGSLAQVQRSHGLDASGLASILASQKVNIAGRIPAEFTRGVTPQAAATASLPSTASGARAVPSVAGPTVAVPKVSLPNVSGPTVAGPTAAPAAIRHIVGAPIVGMAGTAGTGSGTGGSGGGSHWRWILPLAFLAIGLIWYTNWSSKKAAVAVAEKARIEAIAVAKVKSEAAAAAGAAKAKAEAEAATAKARADAEAAAARLRAEAEVRQKAEAEAAATKARAEAEAKKRAEAEAAADKARAELAAKQKAEAETADGRQQAEAKQKADAELNATRARLQAEADAAAAKARQDAEAKQKADTELNATRARLQAEADAAAAKVRQDAEAKQMADAEAAAKAGAAAAARQKAQAEADAERAREQAEAQKKADAEAAEFSRMVAEAKRRNEAAAAAAKLAAEIKTCQDNVTKAATSGPLRFRTASATISQDSTATLDKLVAAIKACPATKMRIEGHTDAEGDAARNQALSENRAKAVVEYLTKAGIDTARLTPEGLGQTKPIAPNDTPENKALNRRIEFVVSGS